VSLKSILEDERTITYVAYTSPNADGDFPMWTTVEGRWKNCEKIVAYPEPGMGAYVPWFAIFDGGEIIARIGAQGMEVGYSK
jgi:hypothetical protein